MPIREEVRTVTVEANCIVFECQQCHREEFRVDDRSSRLGTPELHGAWITIVGDDPRRARLFCDWRCLANYALTQADVPVHTAV